MEWPASEEALAEAQRRVAEATPAPWVMIDRPLVAGAFVCSPCGRAGAEAGPDRLWAAAALVRGGAVVATRVAEASAPHGYAAGYLALREGPVLGAALLALPESPDVLMVNATGRDHPRRAGLALHLGALLDRPTVGVTDRPLLARSTPTTPEAGLGPARGALAALLLDGEEVACWVRTAARKRPLVAHAGWRTDLQTAVKVLLHATAPGRIRTPLPIRAARQAAREARALAQRTAHGPAGALVP